MRTDLCEIVLVADRSGSMAACRSDAEGGINVFIEDQKTAAGDANFTLVQFDTEYDFVHKGTPIKNCGHFTLVPRGNTALLDAVGRAINETGERLAGIPKKVRPGSVVFVIVTDGQENASKEFNWKQVQGMIKHQQDKYQWKFVFLGADITTGLNLGVKIETVASYNPQNINDVYVGTSAKLKAMRSARAGGQSAAASAQAMNFSQQERDDYVK